MSATPGGSTSRPTPYIRARSGGEVDARRVGRVLALLCVVVLAGVAVATTIGAAHQDSSQTRLQRHGVAVDVTVTKCYSYGSGIGQAINFYSCRGDYTLDGHDYTDQVLGGNRALLRAGQVVPAFTVRGDPALLSTATAVGKRFSPWTPYITPMILAALTVVGAVGLVLVSRRSRARAERPPVASEGGQVPLTLAATPDGQVDDSDRLSALMDANLIEVFGQRDAGLRRAAMGRTYAADITFTDLDGTVHGYDAVDEQVQKILDNAPETFVFARDGLVYALSTTAALAWSFGPAGGPPVIRGIDIAIIADGRITSLQTLLSA